MKPTSFHCHFLFSHWPQTSSWFGLKKQLASIQFCINKVSLSLHEQNGITILICQTWKTRQLNNNFAPQIIPQRNKSKAMSDIFPFALSTSIVPMPVTNHIRKFFRWAFVFYWWVYYILGEMPRSTVEHRSSQAEELDVNKAVQPSESGNLYIMPCFTQRIRRSEGCKPSPGFDCSQWWFALQASKLKKTAI